MTSNLGSKLIQENSKSNIEEIREQILELAKEHLKPEFLNRLDEIVIFTRLEQEDMKDIVAIQLASLKKLLLKSQGIELEFSDKLKQYLASRGYDPQFGARPLKRLIQDKVSNKLAEEIISGKLCKTGEKDNTNKLQDTRKVLVDMDDNKNNEVTLKCL